MRKPFKFRYVNELVGAFVLLAVLLLLAGIVVTGRVQGWFEPTYEIRTIFPEQGSMGLRPGAEVRVLDAPVGVVKSIEPREDGELEGVFQIRGRFFQYIRDDSVAIVKLTFGLAGDAYVEITRGRGEPIPEAGAYITITQDTAILDIAEELLEEVRAVTVPAIEQLQLAMEEYTGLAADLRDPDGPVQEMLASLNSIAKGLEAGEGAAGKLLRDPEVAADVERIVFSIQYTVDHVNEILEQVAIAAAELPQITGRLKGEMEDIPGLVYQTQVTLQETEVLLKGLQRHWLLRRYIDEDHRIDDERIEPSVLIGAGEGLE